MAKRRQVVSAGPVAGTVWATDDFLPEPRRRSWPYAPTKLERLAEAAGIDGDDYRLLLAEAIQARRRERGSAWEGLERTLHKREQRQ